MPSIIGSYDPNEKALDALARSMFASARDKKKPGGPNPFGYPGGLFPFLGGAGFSSPFAGDSNVVPPPPPPGGQWQRRGGSAVNPGNPQ